jgi:hypothetical protein
VYISITHIYYIIIRRIYKRIESLDVLRVSIAFAIGALLDGPYTAYRGLAAMAKYKPVPSPEEKFSAGEFDQFLDDLDITDADAARLFGVAEATIKRCRKQGVTGFGARFIITLMRLKLDARKLAREYGVTLTGLSRSRFQAQRERHKPIPKASLIPSELHQAMVLAYLREEGAATIDQLRSYFERKTGKPDLLAPLLADMQKAGTIHCDADGNWKIGSVAAVGMGVARPTHGLWETRKS